MNPICNNYLCRLEPPQLILGALLITSLVITILGFTVLPRWASYAGGGLSVVSCLLMISSSKNETLPRPASFSNVVAKENDSLSVAKAPSKIIKTKSLEEETKITALDVQDFAQFTYQDAKTIKVAYARNVHFYYGNCDDVKDLGWGCAWRCLQTCASSRGLRYTLKDLYIRYYDDFEKVQNGKSGQWAEPGYAQKIFPAGSYQLYLYNRTAGSPKTPTEECQLLPTFEVFVATLFAHFNERHTPVMIDDGITAMNILGIKELETGEVVLWMADPHKTTKNDGLYYVVLDKNGSRIHCTGVDNPFNGLSTTRKADPQFGWMLLLP